jgi:hypothetical protein
MPMTPEERKEYNKTYYENNKVKIIQKGCEKMKCPFCERIIIKNNLLKHSKLEICQRKQQENINTLSRLNYIKYPLETSFNLIKSD